LAGILQCQGSPSGKDLCCYLPAPDSHLLSLDAIEVTEIPGLYYYIKSCSAILNSVVLLQTELHQGCNFILFRTDILSGSEILFRIRDII
jgi:hypothetical protein